MSLMDHSEFRPPRTPLQNFRILWHRATQSFDYVRSTWPDTSPPREPQLATLFTWVYRSSDGSLTRIGERFKDLYYTTLDIGNDMDWFFTYPLGRGGFGVVAMFEKRGYETDKVQDQVAVKTTRPTTFEVVDQNRWDLSKEAAIMGQLNELGEDGSVVLRNFKHYRLDQTWKYYFEFCPYGSLERLRLRYKAYGRYLPEFFLWHLFFWLAKTVHEYTDHNKWCDTSTEYWGQYVDKGFLLHSDIKPQNILLGPPDPNDTNPVKLYPIPRIADFGLSEIQAPYLGTNTAANLDKGTHKWKAPEVRYRQMNRNTSFYPFGPSLNSDTSDAYRKGGHGLTPKTNLWAIGAVMFSMTTLREATYLSRKVNHILREDAPLQPLIADDDWKIISPQYYSIELRDLIKKCLQIRPQDRPEVHEVYEDALTGYSTWLQTIRNRGFGTPGAPSVPDAVNTHPDYKVYYRGNEIDAAPDNGQFDHPRRDAVWWSDRFAPDYPYLDPAWGRLYPGDMPVTVVAPADWPIEWKQEFQDLKDHVRAERGLPPRASQQHATTSTLPANVIDLARAAGILEGQAGAQNRNPSSVVSARHGWPRIPGALHQPWLHEDPDFDPNVNFNANGDANIQGQQQQRQPQQLFNIIEHLRLQGQPGFDADWDEATTQIQAPQTPEGGNGDTPRPPNAPGASRIGDHVVGPVRTQRTNSRFAPYSVSRRRSRRRNR